MTTGEADITAQISDYYYLKSETSSASEIQSALNEKQPSGDYALTSQIPTNVSQLSNDAGYLTEHQSLSNYYVKSETSSASEISDAIAQAGKGYDVTIRWNSYESTAGNGYVYVGGYEFEAYSDPGLIVQHVNSTSTEYLLHGQTIVVVPNGNSEESLGSMVYVNGSPKNNEVITLTGDTLVELYYVFCLLEGTKILLADGTEKNIEDVTYDDVLKVWNFDDGKLDNAKPFWINKPSYTYYWWETKLESGRTIKTTGIYGHRLFDVDKNTFVYASELKAGDRVFTVDGIDVVSSSVKVEGPKVNFYNIITDTHINVIANRMLAGCSLENGLYPVEDMKFVKDGRAIRPYSEFEDVVSEEWYRACRYGESNLSYNYLCNYFRQRNPNMQAKKITLLANSGSNDLSSYGTINMHNYTLHNVGCGQMSSDVMNYKQMTDEIADMLSTSLVSSIGTIPISSFDDLPDLKCSVNSIFDMLSNIVGILKKGSS